MTLTEIYCLRRLFLSVATLGMLCGAIEVRSQDKESFQPVAGALFKLLRAEIFNPAVLNDTRYRAAEQEIAKIASEASNPQHFVGAANAAFSKHAPFSHFALQLAPAPASKLGGILDEMELGQEAVQLNWRDDVAILTVPTMMGRDTARATRRHMIDVAQRAPRALVIDLRENIGGTFAGVPLVEHLIQTPLDAGIFVSGKWRRQNESVQPENALWRAETPWRVNTLQSFWTDVQAGSGLLRVQFQPAEPRYSGPVFVLVSKKTASAAEMTTDALVAGAHAVVVGERTAGQMLSQKPFDLPHGLQAMIPIADYYSHRMGRIESVGIRPACRDER